MDTTDFITFLENTEVPENTSLYTNIPRFFVEHICIEDIYAFIEQANTDIA